VLLGGKNFRPHWPWFLLFLVGTVLATAWYVWAAQGQSALPGGSSLVGFSLGVGGGLICIFEFLLWPRKMVRSWRLGKATTWMRAHIWLGLLAVPFLTFHSGFRFGGPLSAWTMIMFIVVIASGIYGLAVQQYLPSRMLELAPGETIYSQIDLLMAEYAEEAHWLVNATCGAQADTVAAEGNGVAAPARKRAGILSKATAVSNMPAVGRVGGTVVLKTATPEAPVPRSEALRTFFEKTVEPFLLTGQSSRTGLRSRKASERMFNDVRAQLAPAAHPSVQALEDLCEKRRQLDDQARLHWWLHSWLCVHLPLSIALLLLMFVHIFVALKYW
jgi:hypothetical protein